MSADVLKIYRSLSRKPLGHWLFSRHPAIGINAIFVWIIANQCKAGAQS